MQSGYNPLCTTCLACERWILFFCLSGGPRGPGILPAGGQYFAIRASETKICMQLQCCLSALHCSCSVGAYKRACVNHLIMCVQGVNQQGGPVTYYLERVASNAIQPQTCISVISCASHNEGALRPACDHPIDSIFWWSKAFAGALTFRYILELVVSSL